MGDCVMSLLWVFASALIVLSVQNVMGDDAPADAPGTQSIGSFKTPDLDQEETDSAVLPKHMHCDACRAITVQMAMQLPAVLANPGNMYKNKKGVKKAKESAVLEALDKICYGDKKKPDAGLAGYGVKVLNGKNVLSGQGLPAADEPGILMGGSKWPGRIANKCGEMRGEFDEDEIWKTFESGGDLFKTYCEEDCTEDQMNWKPKKTDL